MNIVVHRCLCRMLLLCIIPAPVAAIENLTVEDAVRLAMDNNPRIQAARADVRAAAAREKQSAAPANPEIVLAPSIAGPAGSDEEVFVSQPLEINGSRRARGLIARGESGAAKASAAIVEREVARDVRLAYWDAVLAQASVGLHKENVDMVKSLSAAAKRQVEVGALPGSHAIKADVEVARAEQELTSAESELTQAMWSLKAIMGLRQAGDIRLADSPENDPIEIDEERLCSSALDKRPEIAEAISRAEAARGGLEYAKAARRPDVALQARRESFGGDGGIALGIHLPLLDWGGSRAGVVGARESIAAEELRVESVRDAVTLDVRLAVAKMMVAKSLVDRYERQILSQSEHLVELAEKGYTAGATGYLEVLEAQRTLREVRLAHIDALSNHAKAKAELQWAAAIDVESATEERR